jgi:hypothetical protein
LIQASLLNRQVDAHPGRILVFSKVGVIARKCVALIAEVDFFLLVAAAYPTLFEKLALLATAPLAVFFGKIIQHFPESRILFKNRAAQLGFESFGIGVEVPESRFECQTVFADIAIHMGETFFAAQAAGCDTGFDLFRGHFLAPSI